MASDETEIEPDDPVRTYSPEEQQALTLNLDALVRRVHSGEFSERPISIALLQDLHFALFSGVRGHAGKHRDRGFGQDHLTFGPNRSAHRRDVRALLDQVLSRAQSQLDVFANQPASMADAVTTAVVVHADVIKIHPFEDGNGRTSRNLMNVVMARLNLRPILFEIPKQEYVGALNHYFRERDVRPLVALALRVLTFG